MEKWTREEWQSSSVAELYQGTENITSPAASALLSQSYTYTSSNSRWVIMDLGTGLGQLVEVLYDNPDWLHKVEKIVAGDIDDSLLGATLVKKRENGWKEVHVEKVDALEMGIPDNTFTHLFANFVYLLIPNSTEALKESIRVLQPGGCLGFSTWSSSGPLSLLQKAVSRISGLPSPAPAPAPSPPLASDSAQPVKTSKSGSWTDRTYILQTLSELNLENIKIEEYTFNQTASDARDMARKMRPVLPVMMRSWPQELKDTKGWEVFERIEEIMKEEFGEGPCHVESKAWIVTASKRCELARQGA